MGLHPKFKQWLKKKFESAWMNELEVENRGIKMPPVVIFDATYLTKYSNVSFRTGIDFVNKQILAEFNPSFLAGAKIVYVCFDLGSPVNKQMEHVIRYGKLNVKSAPSSIEDLNSLIVQQEERKSGFSFDSPQLKSNQNKSSRSSFTTEKPKMLKTLEDRGHFVVISDEWLPKKESWTEVMGNPFMRRQIMHYITMSLVMDKRFEEILYGSGVMLRKGGSNSEIYGYVPPNGGILCIHGGCSNRPQSDGTMVSHSYDEIKGTLEWEEIPFKPDNHLITITSTEKKFRSGPTPLIVSIIDDCYPPEELENLLEGEIAATYYSLKHEMDDQLKISSDGDMIGISLLASRNRLLNGTKKFKNQLHLRLKVPKKKEVMVECPGRVAKKKIISGDDYLDINQLYNAIVSDKSLMNLEDPICCVVMVSALMGNDYIKGFGKGINGTDKTGTPWLMHPLLYNPNVYSNIISVQNDDAVDGEMFGEFPLAQKSKYQVHFDDNLFYRYVKETYFRANQRTARIQKQFRNSKVLSSIYPTPLKESIGESQRLNEQNYFCSVITSNENLLDIAVDIINSALKDTKKTMMSRVSILAYGRRVKWLLCYWLNSYHGICEIPDPCQKIEGRSYYGWDYVEHDTPEGKSKLFCDYTDFIYTDATLEFKESKQKENKFQKEERKVYNKRNIMESTPLSTNIIEYPQQKKRRLNNDDADVAPFGTEKLFYREPESETPENRFNNKNPEVSNTFKSEGLYEKLTQPEEIFDLENFLVQRTPKNFGEPLRNKFTPSEKGITTTTTATTTTTSNLSNRKSGNLKPKITRVKKSPINYRTNENEYMSNLSDIFDF